MREIVFRGKRIDNGKWIEGDLLHYTHNVVVIHDNDDEAVKIHKVIPETIGQYTGFKDCNGKRIFEGDIFHLWDKRNEFDWCAVVEFGNPNGEYDWGWQLRYISGCDVNRDILLWVETDDGGAYCETIGNVHDNPELLVQS